MMLCECFDYIDNDSPKSCLYFKGNFKTKTKELRKNTRTYNSKKDYALVYSNGEDTNKIIIDFEIFVRYID
jgi:hypothetical protein